MFEWFRKKADTTRVLGIDLYEDGCALAVVDPAGIDGPTVTAAHWCRLESDFAQSLRRGVQQVGAEGLPAVTTLGQNAYSLVQLEAPDLADDDMCEAMRWRVKDLIDFPVEEAVVDIIRLPESRRPGAPQLIYVAVARAPEVERLAGVLKGAGLRVVAVDILEMAIRNLALHLDRPGRPRAYLHLQPRHSVIEIADGANVYLSRRVLQDIDADSDEELLRAQLENLALEVQRSLDYFESQYALGPADQLAVLACREELFSAFSQVASAFLTVPNQRFDLSGLVLADGVELSQLGPGLPAIGVALRGAA